MTKQKIRRSKKHYAVYWFLLAVGIGASALALQAVALWLPWRPVYEFAANATVWPVIQLGWSVLVLAAAVGFYYILRRNTAIVFGAIGVLTILPVLFMYVAHISYAHTHHVSLDVLAQQRYSREVHPPTSEIRYAQVGGRDLTLSVYRNRDITRRSPAVVYVHGGGWSGGSRDENSSFFRWLNDLGYSVFSIDYRYANSDYATWQDAPADVVCALAWLNNNADAQQIDRGNVTIMGDSAGGQLALRAAYGVQTEDLSSSCAGQPIVPSKVVGIVPAVDFLELYDDPRLGPTSRANVVRYLGGTPYTRPQAYEKSSIISHVQSGLQPTMIINVANDTLVSPDSGEKLARALAGAGVDVEQYTLPYAAHSYWINPGGFQDQISRQLIHRFISKE